LVSLWAVMYCCSSLCPEKVPLIEACACSVKACSRYRGDIKKRGVEKHHVAEKQTKSCYAHLRGRLVACMAAAWGPDGGARPCTCGMPLQTTGWLHDTVLIVFLTEDGEEGWSSKVLLFGGGGGSQHAPFERSSAWRQHVIRPVLQPRTRCKGGGGAEPGVWWR
jgi:hypothetical protein